MNSRSLQNTQSGIGNLQRVDSTPIFFWLFRSRCFDRVVILLVKQQETRFNLTIPILNHGDGSLKLKLIHELTHNLIYNLSGDHAEQLADIEIIEFIHA
jgi:hypothetical protein